jgi:hypothetical protein
MNKRTLQVATGIVAVVSVVTGTIGMSGISAPIYASANLPTYPLLDSNLRFLTGIWLGLGLALFWLIPSIERQGTSYRILWGMIFLGGIGRLLSLLFVGKPPVMFVGFALFEVFGAPVFIYWQYRVSGSFDDG